MTALIKLLGPATRTVIEIIVMKKMINRYYNDNNDENNSNDNNENKNENPAHDNKINKAHSDSFESDFLVTRNS